MTKLIVDNTRGTALWGMNLFRADALSQLLNDLLRRERSGLSQHECEKVQMALGEIVNIASSVPDGSWFRGTIWEELQEFLDIYVRWNNDPGDHPELVNKRQTELKNLRKKRNKIARRIRKNQYILQSELDLQLIDSMYSSFGDLCRSLPDIFTNLSNAIERFEYRKKE